MRILELPGADYHHRVAFSSDGSWLASCRRRNIGVFSLPEGDFLGLPTPVGASLGLPAWSPDGRWLASVARSYRVRGRVLVWDVGAAAEPLSLRKGPNYPGAVVFHPRDDLLLHVPAQRRIETWSVGTWEPGEKLGPAMHGYPHRVAIDETGRRVTVFSADSLYLLDLGTKQPWRQHRLRGRPHGHSSMVANVSMTRDGSRVASFSYSSAVRVWSLPGCDFVAAVRQPTRHAVTALAFSPDGRLLATACGRGIVRLFSAEDWRLTHEFEWPLERINSIDFSPDGLTCAAAAEGKIVVWDLE